MSSGRLDAAPPSAAAGADGERVAVRAHGLLVHEALFQCAESHVLRATFCGVAAVAKRRPRKAYRHAVLDERLRHQRMIREARALGRAARLGVPVPVVFAVDRGDCCIVMERIDGCTVREVLSAAATALCVPRSAEGVAAPPPPFALAPPSAAAAVTATTAGGGGGDPAAAAMAGSICSTILHALGAVIAKLHRGGMIHGDLTTSNFMLRRAQVTLLPWFAARTGSSHAAHAAPVAQQQQQRHHDRPEDGSSHPLPPLPPSPDALLDAARDIVVIDFGLVQQSNAAEDRAVDLYVLERALLSTHPTLAGAAAVVLAGYASELVSGLAADAAIATTVMERLEAVRARGRKRSMLG
jgi:TP53 regulating kinase-like protein